MNMNAIFSDNQESVRNKNEHKKFSHVLICGLGRLFLFSEVYRRKRIFNRSTVEKNCVVLNFNPKPKLYFNMILGIYTEPKSFSDNLYVCYDFKIKRALA